ncbi:MAG: hypothetical protein JXR76_29420 [Deltaproteobacteria bacterium]|nr:hypothetical protein [Deltaproteobacteria bacterium]
MSNKSKFLVFVIIYVGPWPPWLKLFLATCKSNPHIDFLFLSDTLIEPAETLPANVKNIQMDADDIKKRFETGLDMELPVVDGRKIPDLRPFCGLGFHEFIEEYQFWGYCDIDLLWGDLSWALNPEALANVDVFSPSVQHCVGHCTILRNNEEMNLLCRSIPDYKERALVRESTFMDETGITTVIKSRPEIRYLHPKDVLEEMKNDKAMVGISTWDCRGLTGQRNNPGYLFHWDGKRGILKTRQTSCEIMYLHFLSLKQKLFWFFYNDKKDYASFYMSGLGFIPKEYKLLLHNLIVDRSGTLLIDLVRAAKRRSQPVKRTSWDGWDKMGQ